MEKKQKKDVSQMTIAEIELDREERVKQFTDYINKGVDMYSCRPIAVLSADEVNGMSLSIKIVAIK